MSDDIHKKLQVSHFTLGEAGLKPYKNPFNKSFLFVGVLFEQIGASKTFLFTIMIIEEGKRRGSLRIRKKF